MSLSHHGGPAPGTVLAWLDPAASAHGWRIGVDVEDLRSPTVTRWADPRTRAEVDAVAFSEDEQRSLAQAREPVIARVTQWCAKEAAVKALGTGFTGDPAAVSTQVPGMVLRPLDTGDQHLIGVVALWWSPAASHSR
ncbi:MAG: 4'-phosphopantetheinyl transferase superfamily protein [Micrococcus sp.]|nr:4'-phosphopantetheinyl transferase superfamily protein [Micrococcus sp.]